MARRKSIGDITAQSYRIQSALGAQGGNTSRIERVARIAGRYRNNINRAINPWASQGIPADNNRKVSRRVYMGLNAG